MSTAISSPFPHHPGLSHAGRLLLSRKALRTKHVLPEHLLCHLLLSPGRGAELGWTERLDVPHWQLHLLCLHGKQGEEPASLLLPGICSPQERLCWGNTRLRQLQPLQCLDLGCGWCFTQPGGWIWGICWDPAWLFPRNAAEGLVWVAFLPALLSAVLSQVVYPHLRMNTCEMLLVVLTRVSWSLGQESA